MDTYHLIKTLHIISACILLGTGAGIAFFMLRSWFTESLAEKHFAARTTVLADTLFTTPAVLLQPLTGIWLVADAGYQWSEMWLMLTAVCYVVAGVCWLPVVWIQIQLRNLVNESIQADKPLPDRYHRLFRIWFLLGWPAFGAVTAIFFLMVMKPQ